jgi:hypothetical protein
MDPLAEELRRTVEDAARRLDAIPEAHAARRPAPGKWSKKELVGHLIDSAANNHQRFVRARFQDDLVFAGYEQDDWIGAQRYQDAPWCELVALWKLYNLHLARVIECLPQETRLRVHRKHNFDRIAWKTVPANEPATLDYFLRDYLGHLRHHLVQALGEGVAL